MSKRYIKSLNYYSSNEAFGMYVESDIRLAMFGLNRFMQLAQQQGDTEW